MEIFNSHHKKLEENYEQCLQDFYIHLYELKKEMPQVNVLIKYRKGYATTGFSFDVMITYPDRKGHHINRLYLISENKMDNQIVVDTSNIAENEKDFLRNYLKELIYTEKLWFQSILQHYFLSYNKNYLANETLEWSVNDKIEKAGLKKNINQKIETKMLKL